MGRVRPFAEDDIPRVIELNSMLFPNSAAISPDFQQFIFREVCFRNPWYHEDIRSLVYADDNGKVVGFLGVIPRRMRFKGQPIVIAVSQHMMVDPVGRSPFAGIELFKSLLAGPQALSIADMSADITRGLWEKCGGTTALVYSNYWRRILRPATFATLRLQKKKEGGGVVSALMPIIRTFDAATLHIPKNPLRPKMPTTVGKGLTAQALLECMNEFIDNRSLRPEYDERSLAWLLDILQRETRWGEFQKIAVLDSEGKVVGWYLAYLSTDRASVVLQIGGRDNTMKAVLDHLFHHAWKYGAIELEGRLNPVFMKAFRQRLCLFSPGRNWMLVHAKDASFLHAIYNADAWLTRLEGDLWFF
jgi:hypothetical protein